MKSQNKEILNYLKAGRPITPIEALELFGCLRLSGRIYDLRNDGHKIEMKLVKNGKKNFAEYRLIN